VATINRFPARPTTHEGGPSTTISPLAQLRRTALACLLWEDQFYESGQSIADRLTALVEQVPGKQVLELAIEARTQMHLRHLPLHLITSLARQESARRACDIAGALEAVIQRPDELTEFLSLYFAGTRQPLAACVRRGLGAAFRKFNEYSLQKYNRQNQPIKLRDVLRLAHPKPANEEQAALWKRLLKGELATPDTWEVELSRSTDKTASWTRLLTERKLGGLALLRNLRNMQQAGIGTQLIADALANTHFDRVLPFRFIAAAKYAPTLEPQLEAVLFSRCAQMPRLSGTTTLLIDNSGSMNAPLSLKGDMLRSDAAAGLAIIARQLTDDILMFRFSTTPQVLPTRRGFALRDAIGFPNGGTDVGIAVKLAQAIAHDRLIVITDEQSESTLPAARNKKSYIINVGSYENGIGYNAGYTHLTGFSENIFRYIEAIEQEQS